MQNLFQKAQPVNRNSCNSHIAIAAMQKRGGKSGNAKLAMPFRAIACLAHALFQFRCDAFQKFLGTKERMGRVYSRGKILGHLSRFDGVNANGFQ